MIVVSRSEKRTGASGDIVRNLSDCLIDSTYKIISQTNNKIINIIQINTKKYLNKLINTRRIKIHADIQ